ncbi:MAG: peptidylprolyl isomerase [Bacillus sp. (in: Bacteria)]|nr:peptidylprolyl isomerase [Bacillus sp. (in: firmicutes)]MCM1427236.1 peptidylprolyl isomerase [Eubacterium sp.]
MRNRKKTALCLLMIGILAFSLTGCAGEDVDNVKVVLTTGFDKDEIFRIETISCTMPEMMVYLTNIQNQYESAYGTEIWNINLGDVTLEQNVKDMALAQIAQVKTMNLMAKRYELTLTKEEETQIEHAAQAYYTSLNDMEKQAMGVDEDIIENLYEEYALAHKVYQYIIKDINPEISDDEARTITVQHILIKTYALDGTGKKIEYTEKAKEDSYRIAKEVWEKAVAGDDFDELIRHYNEDDKSTYSFGKGEMDPAYERAAFNLGTGEISDVVETGYGYHIIKCISTFDKEETDSNKIKIVEKRKDEVFGQEYDAFVDTLTRKLNEEVWENVRFIHDENVVTMDFFDIYDTYFEE